MPINSYLRGKSCPKCKGVFNDLTCDKMPSPEELADPGFTWMVVCIFCLEILGVSNNEVRLITAAEITQIPRDVWARTLQTRHMAHVIREREKAMRN